MSSIAVACVAFACTLTAAVFGMFIQRRLPDHHLNGESKDTIKLGLGLIATLSALVLGLLVATAKGTYDVQSASVKEIASNAILLDRVLARYGPETNEVRKTIPNVLKALLQQMWPGEDGRAVELTGGEARIIGEDLFDKISAIEPKNDAQRMLKSRAMEVMINMAQARQRMFAQKESSIPTPFLVVMFFWLTILFASYGLLAPRNLTVFSVLVVCMLSVAGALFLVMEMDRPFEGIIRVSNSPMREALSRIGD